MVKNFHLKGEVAIVGVGFSTMNRNSTKSVGGHALEACRNAILDAGLDRSQIDGVGAIYGTDLPTVWPPYVVEGLGLPNVVWNGTAMPPSSNTILQGAYAVFAGACDYALCYHAKYRWDTTSAAARRDPLRESPPTIMDPYLTRPLHQPYAAAFGFGADMRRHMHDYGTKREHFGMVALNNRTNAGKNPRAIAREPLTWDEYLSSPMVYEPMCMLDMDVPIDGAQAVILTRTDNLPAQKQHRPVVIEATAQANTVHNEMSIWPENQASYNRQAELIWDRSGLDPREVDLAMVYDGFTILTVEWLQALFCSGSNPVKFLEDSWVEKEKVLRFFGRIPMSPHGGNLSEGRIQGMGFVTESVLQLRGEAGPTQVSGGPRTAVIVNGNAPTNACLLLRRLD